MDTPLETRERHIEPPPDFPVAWANPDDASYHWTRDCEHNPHPITPMFSSFAALTAGAGRPPTVRRYAEAILARADLEFNGYNFTRLIPFQGTPQELAARMSQNQELVNAVVYRLPQVWETEWLPALQQVWRFWETFDLEHASLPELSAHLEGTIEQSTRLYEIHYLMGPPMWTAIETFEQFYCDLFLGARPLDAHRLLQGFDNITLQIGREMWQLARLADAVPSVRQALLAQGETAAYSGYAQDFLAGLRLDPAAQRFIQALQDFLSTYGRRSDLWDWGYPSWEEDPTPLLNNLRNYLSAAWHTRRDPQLNLAEAAAVRTEAVALARQQIATYPAPVVQRFETLLSAAQCALTLTENHTYYIDFNGFGWVHRVIFECGKRLAAAQRLDQPQDVFFLTIHELRQALADLSLNLSVLAAARRQEHARWSAYPAPLELGTRPTQPLVIYSSDGRRMARYLGALVADASQPTQEPGLLRGQSGSGGVVRGRARVILSLAEAYRLQPGEILVTITTAPPWTPLFLTAAGLVTDAGGLLSHGAVVAREYGIPAVVGTGCATRQIQDGQWIEVNGNDGTVRFMEE